MCYQKGLGFLGGIKSKITKKDVYIPKPTRSLRPNNYPHVLVSGLSTYQVIQHDFQKRFYGISLHQDCSMSKKWVYV